MNINGREKKMIEKLNSLGLDVLIVEVKNVVETEGTREGHKGHSEKKFEMYLTELNRKDATREYSVCHR